VINEIPDKITKEYIQENLLRSDGRLNSRIINQIKISKEEIYCIYNDMSMPYCQSSECTNIPKFISFNKGFHKFCSSKCSNNDKDKKLLGVNNTDYVTNGKKISKSLNDKDNWNEVIEKRKSTNRKTYGFDFASQSSEVKQKMINTNLSRHGCEFYTQTEVMKEKSKLTKLDRYGYEYYNNPVQIKENEKRTKMLSGFWIKDEDRNDFDRYSKLVRTLSEKIFKKYHDTINPYNLIRSYSDYHLDHKISVFEGFMKNIPIFIIASKENLQMLPCKENLLKSKRSIYNVDKIILEFYKN